MAINSSIIGGSTNIGGSSSGYSISITGITKPTRNQYDIKTQKGNNIYNTIDLSGFIFDVQYISRDPNASLPTLYVKSLKLYVGGKLCNHITFDTGALEGYPLLPGSKWRVNMSDTSLVHYEKIDLTFENDATYFIDVEIIFSNGQSKYQSNVESIQVLDPYIKSIYISQEPTKKEFFINEEFTYSSLVVSGYRYFSVSQNYYDTVNISSFSVEKPDMSVPAKNKIITVSAQGKTATYTINIIGVESFVLEQPSKIYFRNGESFSGQPNAIINWDDGVAKQINASELSFSGFDIGNKSIQTITATYFDEITKTTLSSTYQIEVCKINGLVVSGEYKKTYNTNEQLDFENVVLTATYGKANDKVININDVAITKPNMSTPGTKTVFFTYVEEGVTVSDSYVIDVIGLEDLIVETTNQTLLFITNSDFSLNNIKVFAKINGETKQLNSSEYNINYENVDNTKAGNYTVYVSYTHYGITKTKEISVEIYALSNIYISGGLRTYYIVDGVYPTLDLTGLVVEAVYTNKVVKKLSQGYTVTPKEGTLLSKGTQTIVISYEEGGTRLTGNLSVSVFEDYPIEITGVNVNDLKTIYEENELFSKSGIMVFAKMASGQENIPVAFTTNLDDTLITKNEELIIKVGNLTFNPNVIIYCNTLESIHVLSFPNKTRYKIGESFDTTGLRVSINSSQTGARELSKNEYTCSFSGVFTADDVGVKTITINYNNKETSIGVSVVKLKSIVISNDPTKTYIRGDNLDTSKLTATKYYTDDVSETLSVSLIVFDKTKLFPEENQKYCLINASYTEQGITAQDSFQVLVKALSGIELSNGTSKVDKIYLDYNSQVVLTNYYVKKIYNDGTSELELITDSMMFNGKNEYIKTAIESSINYTFAGETKYYNFTFHCYYLGDIVIASNPNKTSYFENELLDLSGLSVQEVIYCTDKTINSSVSTITNYQTNLTNGQKLSFNDKEIIVSYTKNTITKSKKIGISVQGIVLEEITVSGSAKLEYYTRQNLNVSDIVVQAKYNNGSTTNVLPTEYDIVIGNENVSKTILFTEENKARYNNQTLYVEYQGKKTTLGIITIESDIIFNIEINSTEHKTEYFIGDYFSTDKLSIFVNYVSGYSETRNSGFNTDYDSFKKTKFSSNDIGEKLVSVNYEDKTTTYNIKVEVPKIAKVVLDTTAISLTPTNGTEYSLSNLVVYVEFANGYQVNTPIWISDVETVLNIQNGMIECTNNLGKKEVTITATNPFDENDTKETILVIDVLPNKQLKSISLKYTSEDYDTYRIGEKFTAKGISLRAEFQDAEPVEDITNFSTYPEIGSILRSGGRKVITVFYNYLGTELSLTYTINVLMSFESGKVKTTTYKPVFNVDEYTYEEATLNKDTLGFDLVLLYPDVLVKVDDNLQSKTYGKNILTDLTKINECVGYLDLGVSSEFNNETIKNAHVVFFEDITNPISGDGNIVVKFPRYIPGQADKINKCKFGVLYNKRLFVSGNEDYKNFDWHSSQITVATTENYKQDSNKDLTYFSDLDYCKYGSEESEVVGYDIYRDGSLLVIKNGSRNEATLYTRKLEYTNAMSYDGGVIGNGSYVEESFPCFDINKNGGVGGLSNRSIVNFNGDSLVMTPAGLKLIASSSQVYDNSKYTFDVSNKINNKILKEDIKNSHAFVFKDRVYVKTNRGVYVGEYTLKNKDTKEYEWYYLNNINTDLFFEYDNELYFANNNGEICKFDHNDYYDKDRLYISKGGIALNNGEIIISNKYKNFISNGNDIHILESANEIHASLSNFIESNHRDNLVQNSSFNPLNYNGVIDAKKNVIRIEPYDSNNEIDWDKFAVLKGLYVSNKEIYFDNIKQVGTKIQPYTKYYLKQVESDDPCILEFEVYYDNGKRTDLSTVDELRMSYKVSALSNCKIVDVTEEINDNLTFGITGDMQEKLELINYNNYAGEYSAVITRKDSVKAYYITKPLDMGSVITNKTIWAWFVVNDTDLASEVDVGYFSSRRQGDFNIVVDTTTGSRQLNFDKMNFTQLQWTSDKLPRIHPTYKTVPNVGFIRFIFKNEEPTNMVLTKLSLIYTLNNLIGGIK